MNLTQNWGDGIALTELAMLQISTDWESLLFLHSKGKGLFATRNIHKGETIFVEKPVVSSQFLWNALYRYKGERRVVGFKTGGTLSSPTLMSCITKP
uniref:SET domain-containing protein n=1 Tax=Terrapene triunguis TaxID=2587831 RepID=A0A674J6K4_9SAUR